MALAKNPRFALLFLATLTLLTPGCGPTWMNRATDDGTGPVIEPGADGGSAADDASLLARRAFENPGGMWEPAQLAEQTGLLKKLGLQFPPEALSDPLTYPLGAVIFLGGCTASFVSPQGLLITNHHCATRALQVNSKPEQNLLKDGFLAKTIADERSNGPTARVFVTQAFRDVTAKVRAGIDAIAEPKKRYDTIEQRTKDLIAACEKGRPQLRCRVSSYFGGSKFLLVEQLELRDVRLVYVPAEGIGNFGGEVDNWRWPRHTGDFAFFRAYVGKDLKPADYSESNVPYRPKHYLRLPSQPLSPSDLVFVAGYPARTTRLKTASEVAEAVDWYYPRRLKLCDDYIALLEKLGKQDQQLAIKGRYLLRGLANVRTNTKGMLDGLVRGGLKARKIQLEQELRKWLGEHPEHAQASQALDKLAASYKRHKAGRDKRVANGEAVWMSTLLGAADTIVQMAQERPKPDADRDPRFQQRNHKRLEQAQQHKQRNYARQLDREKLKLALLRAARLPAQDRPEVLGFIVGKAAPSAAAIDAALRPMYDKTSLEDEKERVRLLREATVEQLQKSKDPFIELALSLRPILEANEERDDAYAGETLVERPVYVSALRAQLGGVLAPDANQTLRITYGTVRGYKPKPDAKMYFPFTKLSGMVAKSTGVRPFDAPAALVEAANSGPYGRYKSAAVGEVPVDFLTDLDITGGNSGSPTLNARGELVGLAFDGNYEAMASDWVFIPEITRSIHVDIRYVLWLMDRVDRAHRLLREMDRKPEFE